MVQEVKIVIIVRYSYCEFAFPFEILMLMQLNSILLDMSQHHRKIFIGMSLIFITFLITKFLSWESTFSIKYPRNSVGLYKRPYFGCVKEFFYQLSQKHIMDEAFMCRCFLLLFDVVFLIFEYSISRKLLQSNLVFFNTIFPHWVFCRLNSSSSWTLFLLRRIFAFYVRWRDAALSTSFNTFFKVLSEMWISLFAVGILLLPST